MKRMDRDRDREIVYAVLSQSKQDCINNQFNFYNYFHRWVECIAIFSRGDRQGVKETGTETETNETNNQIDSNSTYEKSLQMHLI